MRYDFYTPKERWIRIIAAILVIVCIVVGIIAINRCSEPPKKVKPPLYLNDSTTSNDDNDTTKTWSDTLQYSKAPDLEDEETDSIDEWPINDEEYRNNRSGLTDDRKDINYNRNNLTDDWRANDSVDRNDSLEDDTSDDIIAWQEEVDGYDDVDNASKTENKYKRDKPKVKQIIPNNSRDNIHPSKNQRIEEGISINDSPDSNPYQRNNNPIKGEHPLWIVIMVILLIAYIIAKIMSGGGVLIIWATPFDKLLVIVSAILFFITWLIDDGHGFSQQQITLLTISGLLMLVSIILSIIFNIRSLLNIILSILAKFFVFVLTNIALILLIAIVFFDFMIRISKRSRDDSY